jgi:hypothetical protein
MGYFMKQNRGKHIDELVKNLQCVVEHLFDNHEFCDEKWCPKKQGKNMEKGRYRCKEKNAKLYAQLTDIAAPYMTEKMLAEANHPYDTQMNEALNNSVAKLAPKNKVFGTSMSLTSRIAVVAGIQIYGWLVFYSKVFAKLGIIMPEVTKTFTSTKQHLKDKPTTRI